MKKAFTPVFTVLAAMALCSGFVFVTPDATERNEANMESLEKHRERYGEANEEAEERWKWELRRLAAPDGKIPDGIRAKELAFAATLPNDAALGYAKSTLATLDFQTRGPWNHGGRTRAFAIDATNENVLLAGPVAGGIWRSTDGGQSWARSSALNQLYNVTCIAQDTRAGHTNTWYYGSGEAYGNSASGGSAFYLGNGVYKSTDGGNTWAQLASTSSNTPQTFDNVWDLVWRVATDPSNTTEDEVYAATYGAIWRSVDGGTTWTVARGGTGNNNYFTDVMVTPTGVVYATLSSDGTQGGIWRSADGINWTNIMPVAFGAVYDRIVMGYNPQNENEVYFLAVTPGSGQTSTDFQGDPEQNSLWKYTYVSGDGSGAGGTWDDRSANLPNNGGQFGNFNAQGGYNLVVKVKPDDLNTVFIGGTNIFRSTDGFATSNNITQIGGYDVGTTTPFFLSYPNQHPDQHEFAFIPSNPDKFISICDGGLFKTDNVMAPNVTWTSLNRGYLSIQFYTVGINKETANDPVIIAGTQDNGTLYTNSTDPQFNWTLPFNGDGAHCAITNNGQYYYYSRQLGRVVKSTMNSGTGQINQLIRIDPQTIDTTKYEFINPFVLDPVDNDIMYMGGGDRLWRNRSLDQFIPNNTYAATDQGWDFIAGTEDTTRSVTAIVACKTPAHRVYFGTDRRKFYRIDNADSNTPTVTPIFSTTAPTVMPASGYVSCIAVDPTDGDKIIVVFSNYGVYSLYYSEDAGATWDKIGGNLEQTSGGGGNGPSVRYAAILPLQDGNTAYFVGTSVGVFATDKLDGVNTVWVQQGTNTIGNAVVNIVETRPADGLVVIATHSNGLYTTNITNISQITSATEVKAADIDGVTLFPNPAQHDVTLEFELKQKQKVVVLLTDANGKAFRSVHNGTLPAGVQKLPIPRNGLPAGVYYATIYTEQRTKLTKQVIWVN